MMYCFSNSLNPPAAVDWGVAAVAAAALVTRLRPLAGDVSSVWPGLLRAIAGLAIWFSVSGIAPLGLNPSIGNPETLPMVLAWIAALPATGAAQERPYKRFLRVLLLPSL